jgi:pseudaminic acid synthase
MDPFIEIDKRVIGPGHPTYVIAEMSANHHQDFEQAIKIIEAAKNAGADAVKLQTYTPDTLTINSRDGCFKIDKGTPWKDRYLYDLYSEAYMPWEWQPKLKKAADNLKIQLFSSPFDATAVDFLEDIGVPAYKIASFEIVDIPLIRRIADTQKPIILSTGMATLEEIEEAISTIGQMSGTRIALLKCTSSYPAPPEEMNLKTLKHLYEKFKLPVGISDHTLGVTVPTAAVALGACIIEKHLTLSRSVFGPDSTFSLEPREFKDMVQAVRLTEKALGEESYNPTPTEGNNRIFRKSLFIVRDVKEGEILTTEDIRSIRPGFGLHPRYMDTVLGRRTAYDIRRGTPLDWKMIE